MIMKLFSFSVWWAIATCTVRASTTMDEIALITVSNGFKEGFTQKHNNTAEETEAKEVFGSATTFSNDGSSVAMSTWWGNDYGKWSGIVRVYKYDGHSWEFLHGDINFVSDVDDQMSGTTLSISDDGNTVTIGDPSLSRGDNSWRDLQVFENNGRSWIEQNKHLDHQAQEEVQNFDPFSRTLTRVCVTDAPTPVPPRGRSTVVTIKFLGTCQPSEEISQLVAETAIGEGFDQGVTSSPGGMIPSCGPGFGRSGSTSRNEEDEGPSLEVGFNIDQAFDDCGIYLTDEEIHELVQGNEVKIAKKVKEIPAYQDIEVEEIRLIEAPSDSPSLSHVPSLSVSPSTAPTIAPTRLDERTFTIVTSYPNSEEGGSHGEKAWCLQAKNRQFNSELNIRACRSRYKQLFFLDQFGQLRLRSDPFLCIRYMKKRLYIGACEQDGATKQGAQFSFDREAGSIVVEKKNQTYLVGISTKNVFDKIRLFVGGSLNANASLTSWNFKLYNKQL